EVPAQQIGELLGVELVGLDLRLGDDPRLVRVSQHDLVDSWHPVEHVVKLAPVPARLHRHFRAAGQAVENGAKPLSRVAGDASLNKAPAITVDRRNNRVALVVVDPNEYI